MCICPMYCSLITLHDCNSNLISYALFGSLFFWGGGGGVKSDYPAISKTIYGHDFKHGKYEILLCRGLANYVQLLAKKYILY